MPRVYLSPPHLSGRELEYLKDAIDCAKLNNIRPILALYPGKPTAIGSRVGLRLAR